MDFDTDQSLKYDLKALDPGLVQACERIFQSDLNEHNERTHN